MKSNMDRFLNRVLYSFYNLIYLSGLPIYATVELLVQRPLYCLPFWKRRLRVKKTKIAWTIGTTLTLCLLILANFMLMWCYDFLYN